MEDIPMFLKYAVLAVLVVQLLVLLESLILFACHAYKNETMTKARAQSKHVMNAHCRTKHPAV